MPHAGSSISLGKFSAGVATSGSSIFLWGGQQAEGQQQQAWVPTSSIDVIDSRTMSVRTRAISYDAHEPTTMYGRAGHSMAISAASASNPSDLNNFLLSFGGTVFLNDANGTTYLTNELLAADTDAVDLQVGPACSQTYAMLSLVVF
jgi:hypothetical protein